MKPAAELTQWKLIGHDLIDVGHGIVIEVKYIGKPDTYKSHFVDHVVVPLFAAAEALHRACQLTLGRLERADSVRASQLGNMQTLRDALRLVPPVDKSMLQFVLSHLDKDKH